jgi:hypothetical protein
MSFYFEITIWYHAGSKLVFVEKVHKFTYFKASKKVNNQLLEMRRSDKAQNWGEAAHYYI